MNRLLAHSLVFKSIITSLLYFLSSSVWAGGQGTLTYGVATPVPTMSGVMLVVLALLLATITYRILRQKKNSAGRMMVLSLLAVGTLASGVGGIKLINDAYANGLIQLTGSGGTINIFDGPDPSSYINKTGAITEILGRTSDEACGGFDPTTDECTIGKQLGVDQICNLDLDCF